MKKFIPALGFGVAWVAALVFVQAKVLKYEATPAPATVTQVAWPASAAIKRASEVPTLVLLAHPQCPCTRATMTELEKIVEKNPGRLKVQALFFKPAAAAAGWERTSLWNRAAAMKGVSSIVDVDGRMARQFGMHTSGEVAVFATDGTLLFQGGITQGRGHEGDNAGAEAVMALAAGEKSITHTPVFGCEVLPRKANGNSTTPALATKEFGSKTVKVAS